MHNSSISLSQLAARHSATITGFSGNTQASRRFIALGLAPGSCVKVLQKTHSSVILALGNTRLAIARQAAEQILIEQN